MVNHSTGGFVEMTSAPVVLMGPKGDRVIVTADCAPLRNQRRNNAEFEHQTAPALRTALAARETVMVPASLPLPAALAQLRHAGEQFACVGDEYSGLAGVITLEDIAEELVGEITDEHDDRRRPAALRHHPHRRGGAVDRPRLAGR